MNARVNWVTVNACQTDSKGQGCREWDTKATVADGHTRAWRPCRGSKVKLLPCWSMLEVLFSSLSHCPLHRLWAPLRHLAQHSTDSKTRWRTLLSCHQKHLAVLQYHYLLYIGSVRLSVSQKDYTEVTEPKTFRRGGTRAPFTFGANLDKGVDLGSYFHFL